MQFVWDNTDFFNTAFQDLSKVVKNHKELLTSVKDSDIDQDIINQAQDLLEQIDIEYLLEEIPTAVKSSFEGLERVKKIVTSMKEFVRSDQDDKVTTNIHKCIEDTVTVAKNEWKYVSNLTLDLASDMPLVICNPNEIKQVVLNLIVNSVQAISDKIGDRFENKGEIRIQTAALDDRILIKVIDNGAGIQQSDLDRIFDPFFTTKKAARGSGQGLAISKAVIEDRHQGKIRIETEMDKGSTFIIELPINADSDEK